MITKALRVPLVVKLLGTNLLIVSAALALHASAISAAEPWVAWAALVACIAVNVALVRLALKPLDELTRVAEEVTAGESLSRAVVLPTADARIAGLIQAFNRLLDRAAADRDRIEALARMCLNAREVERAAFASQLREGTAQQLYGLVLQLAALRERNADADLAPAIVAAGTIAADAVDETRRFADSVHTGLIPELGLRPGLEALAARLHVRTGMDVVVELSAAVLAEPEAAALYGAAEEALRNVEFHSFAHAVRMSLAEGESGVELVIEDDGLGFDAGDSRGPTAGIGLFRARELLAQVGGRVRLDSAPGRGTTVRAVVPGRMLEATC